MNKALRSRYLGKMPCLGILRHSRPRPFSTAVGIVWLLIVLIGISGCTRRYFRENADKEVDSILGSKDRYPEWKIEQFHVYPDPRARFADPTNPDRPPMPPDDRAAFDNAPNAQKPGKAGIAYIEGSAYLDLLAAWDAENRARLGGRPSSEGQLPFLINLDQSCEL